MEIFIGGYTYGLRRREVEEMAEDLLYAAVPKVSQKYNIDERSFRRLVIEDYIRFALESFLAHTDCQIEGKRILDLGCGSFPQKDFPEQCKRMYEPWLCRVLYEIGASPIGVDIGSMENEEFEQHSLDLMQPNCLDNIPDASIDFAHSRLLMMSPTLDDIHGASSEWKLRENLLPQLNRIGKPGSLWIFDGIWG